MRPLDFLGRIKVKLGIVIVLAVATAFVVNEVGINSGLSREVRIAVAVVLALIMVQVLAMGMTKPLREMARAAQTIAKGSYTLRVRATSRDEVGELARAFNAMAADLGEVDRQRRELVANVSHELRTPITGLRAILENVVDGVSAADPVTMRTALAQTERLGRLVAQLLDLSRLDSGTRLIEAEDVEPAALVEQAVLEASLAREDVVIQAAVPDDLVVRADPDLLAQVLSNLLDNAVRHSPPGGSVTVGGSAEGDGIRLVVADSGPGIPAEARGRVFERFSRLDAGRAADAGGAGLGLAIVKEIVELHGGSIRIDDCAGCRMVVDLPGRTTVADVPLVPNTGDETEGVPTPSGIVTSDETRGVLTSSGVGTHDETRGVLTSSGVGMGAQERTAVAREGAGAAKPAAGPSTAGPSTAGPSTAGPSTAGPSTSERFAAEPEPIATAPALATATGGDADAGGRLAASAAVDPSTPDHPRDSHHSDGGRVGRRAGGDTTGDTTLTGVAGAGGRLSDDGRTDAGSTGVPAGVGGAGNGGGQPAGGAAPGGGFLRMVGGGVVGLLLGFLVGMFAAVFVSVTVGDEAALVTLVLCVALMGGVGAAVGAGSWRRAATATYEAAGPYPGQVGSHPGRVGSHPGRVGSHPGQVGSHAGQVGSHPGQVGPHPRQVGSHAGQVGSHPGQVGSHPGQVGSHAGQVGSYSGRGSYPGQGGGPYPGGQGGGPGQPPAYVPPPLLPRPEVPDAPRWLLPAAAGAGAFAAVALPDAQAGLGLVLVAMVLGAGALPAVTRRMTPWTVAFGLTAYGLISMAAVRDADWLVAILLVAGAGLGALAVSGAGAGWLGVIRGGASVLLALGPVPWFLAGPVKKLTNRRRVLPTVAALGITAVLLAVFGLLFASADAVFASYVKWLTTTPDWADSAPLRIFLFVLFGVLLAAVVLVALRPVADPVGPGTKFAVSRSIWLLPLTAVNLLFAAFVAVQITALFGGDTLVLRTAGLTYAEYARQGFFQLVVVSVFVLGIVAVAAGLLKVERRERWVLAGLLGVLCGLTMVVLASALHRMNLYTDAYGLSRLRLSVEATVWWLGALFTLVMVAGAARLAGRGSGRLPRTVVLVTGLALGAFAIVNPDLRVAQSQVDVRGVTKMDSDYLGDLGAEAVPALDRLPEPQRSCVLADVVAANDLDRPDPWNGWNLARSQARDLLAKHPIRSTADCPPAFSRGSG